MTIDVDALKARNPIERIIGSFAKLTRDGKTYRGACPVHGGNGPNLVVYPDSGSWHCFSCNCQDGHSDVIGFIELMLDMDFQRATEYLGAEREWKPELVKPPRPPQPERVTSKPPPDSGVPKMAIKGLGEPTATWEYKDTDGGTLGYVARYETQEGKEIRQFSWGARGTDAPTWGCGHFSKPRPCFHLERLEGSPDKPVLITEGEKACEAAQSLLPGYVCITWPGGAQAWKHADFSPLSGKTVLLWPDNDQIGVDCMSKLAQVLADPAGLACKVRIIDPTGQETGWDAADFTGTTEELIAWAKPRASDVTYSSAAQEPNLAQAVATSPFPPAVAPTLEPSAEPLEPPASDLQPEPPYPEGTTTMRPAKPPRKRSAPRLASVEGNTVADLDADDAILPLELSEIGVAARFCDLYHEDFRVVHEWGGKHGACWLYWDGSRWVREANRKTAYQRMSLLCCGLKYHTAARGMTEAAKSKFERTQFVSSCLNQAQYDARLIAAPDIWDANPMMIGTPDGAVDLSEGKLIESSPEQFITRQTTVAPARGPHPLFDDVIRRAAAGDADMTAYLWRALGYGAVTGCVNEEVFWYLWGKPQCGKTTLIEAIADILGDVDEGGYACQVEIDIFTEQKQDSRNADRLAHLAGARFAYASEMEEGKNFKAALLKMAVGGDRMGGKFLYQERFTFKPSHHIWIFGNQIMHLRTADQGIKRRMHLIEYDDKFLVTDEERDNNFKQKLKAEYPAILQSLIDGAQDWLQCGGLGRPEQVERKVDDYMQAEDTLAEFVESCLKMDTGARCKSSTAYAAYKAWCERNGEFCPSGKRFSQQMRSRGFTLTRTASGQFFNGFSLIPSTDERSPPPSYDRD